jgi:hypothetical protein
MMNKMFQKQGLAALMRKGMASQAQAMRMHTLRCLFTSQQTTRKSAMRAVNYGMT